MSFKSNSFVSLEKYTNDITSERLMNSYARKKFERIDVMLKRQIASIDSLMPSVHDFCWLEAFKVLRAGLQDILDIERPDVAAYSPPPSLDKVHFSSVADGVPCYLDFEGER